MNIDWSKRIKSFLMGAASLIGMSLIGTVLSPDFQALVVNLGVPGTIVSALGLMLAEAWKEWINSRKLRQAGVNSIAGRIQAKGVDLY